MAKATTATTAKSVEVSNDAPATNAPATNAPANDAPANDAPANDKPAEPVYQSDLLDKLRIEEAALEDKLDEVGNKTPEGKKIRLQLWEIGNSIENEINAIKKRNIELEAEARKQAIVSNFWDMFELKANLDNANAKLALIPMEERKPEDLVESNNAYKLLHDVAEPILNKLLGGMPTVKKSTTATTTGATSGTKGKTTSEIREIIAPLYGSKTPAEIRAYVIKELGYNDGTANAVILQYEKENNLNGKSL